MSDKFGKITRKNRYEKKRTNTKAITWLTAIGGVLAVLIITLVIVGGGDEEPTASGSDNSADSEPDNHELNNPSDESTDMSPEEESSEKELEVVEDEDNQNQEESNDEDEEASSDEETETQQVESNDSNVSEAYEGNWQAVDSEQSEPAMTFEKGSVDWNEMQKAVEVATGIPVGEQVVWYLGRAGEQQAEATVSPTSNQDQTYRVSLQWAEGKGWQPTLVEELKENDKKS
ncbi:YrrS family protein [Gracilibacillus salinarum]|uniref:YrrS family protein n=1 Tax=Gracilibacillus salinarum TaxID=2932255 RepID=A0ABY4GP02_9BACI|nr:YrrS family protein [Gracilibacillus salinarum]UOQ86098.1 YrrS family protein [Gracilibacillus salinarum]